MPTFVLIPGAGSDSTHWHLVRPLLEAAGHDVVTPDLPCESDDEGLPEYAAAVHAAIGDRDEAVVLVAQSLGAFTAAQVAAERPTALIVYVNAMIPAPGESPGTWWDAVGHAEAAAETLERHGPMSDWTEADIDEVFLHDVPAESLPGVRVLRQAGGIFATPLTAWPGDVPPRVISGLDDRLFALEPQRRIARERLGAKPEVVPTGHLAALADPAAPAERLLASAGEL